jgi:SulP family sulfate permease
MISPDLIPQFFTTCREGFRRDQLLKDIVAGVVVGIVALPLAIAFAIASGATPAQGILTAIVGGLIISLLGGSRVQIGGPTGAFIVIILGIMAEYGMTGLLIATFLAGVMILLMGVFRLGSFLKFVPQTLITGFTAGIAIIIFSTQVKDFLGLTAAGMPGEFLHQWVWYVRNIRTATPWSVIVGTLTVLIIVVPRRLTSRVPWTFVALVVTSALAALLRLPVETIGSRFGSISFSFPDTRLSLGDLGSFRQYLLPAVSIAILGALESLLSAMVADGMIGGRHRSNAELMAQGLANMALPFLGGIPATGAIARTVTNIKNGGRTPVAGIVHALVLLAVFAAAMPVASAIPMATLAGILVVVAWNMGEFRMFFQSFRVNFYEASVLALTFLLTLFTDLTFAIPAGFVLSVVLFMKRMSDSVEVTPLLAEKDGAEKLFIDDVAHDVPGIAVFEVNGPIFFGSVHHFLEMDNDIRSHHEVVILRLRYVPIIDSSGLARLKALVRAMDHRGVAILFSGVNEKVKAKLLRQDVIHQSRIFADFGPAMAAAKARAKGDESA